MTALVTFGRTAVHRGESLLSRERLRRTVEEKFTRDLLAMRQDTDPLHFSTAAVTLADGEAESQLQPVPAGLTGVPDGLYLVVVATLTKSGVAPPNHLRLETLLTTTAPEPPASPLPTDGQTLEETVEAQLRLLLTDEEQIQQVKTQVLAQLKEAMGSDAESFRVSIETNEYRPAETAPTGSPAPDAFTLDPISIAGPNAALRVRVWKETYY